MNAKTDKVFRLLQMNERLSKGEAIIKETAMAEFGIPAKTFQRDIDSFRLYLLETGNGDLVYDRKNNCYRLQAKSSKLTKEEIFAVCKVLIESRAFNRAEFNDIIEKLLQQCEVSGSKTIKNLIANEQVNYIPLQHGQSLNGKLWQLAEGVKKQMVIKLIYKRSDNLIREHMVKPVGVMFSEFYFYLIAYMADSSKEFPTVFRVDRIISIECTGQKFDVPYAERFSEAEFRKRTQFMYAGELRVVRFLYRGALEAVLDRLPTAKVEKQTDEGMIIRAESYGSGIDIWMKSQGEKVDLL